MLTPRLRRRSLFPAIAPIWILAVVPSLSMAQVSAPAVGTIQTGLLLRQLDGEKRVLMIGAHPDDEDTSLLTALSRGYGVQTAYLSLTRGEGGQNLIGPELREGLALVRTGELVSARAIDGGEQFFTRALDFGFSKSAEETFGQWPEEELVRDLTWVIRTFRPHVILSVFTGTPRDGHGQHQVAGIVTRRAFEVAGDPTVFPDQLDLGVEPWEVRKLYQLNRFGSGTSNIVVQTGTLDPLLGRSYHQLAMESRSQHRSQDMGSAQSPGPRTSGATLIDAHVPVSVGEDEGLFTGVDTTLVGLVSAAAVPDRVEVVSLISSYREAISVASELLHPSDPTRSVAALQDALVALRLALLRVRSAPAGPGRTELVHVLEARERRVMEALLSAGRVMVDTRVERDRLIPGEEVEVDLLVWNGGRQVLSIRRLDLVFPEGWTVSEPSGDRSPLGPGEIRTWRFTVGVPSDAELSKPYFLRDPIDGSLYRWRAEGASMGRPGDPPLILGEVEISVGDGPWVRAVRTGTYVGVDQADGEFRVPVFVVPAASVAVEPRTMVWPSSERGPRTVAVQVATEAERGVHGQLSLVAPEGWEVAPASQAVGLEAPGSEASYAFELRPSAEGGAGYATLSAVLRSADGAEYREGVTFIDYRHIDPAPLFQAAELTISYFQVEVPDVTVGYIMGPGDSGPEALADLGVEVELLSPEAVRSGDLDRFDTIVLGIRAYETREDLRSANGRLLDYARRGGTIVSQYQQYQYPEGGYAPLQVEMASPHDRVTDEGADVTLLVPDHPILASPNRIAAADFEGWTQERGLYFLSSWDEGFTPLLEMADPGESPKQGSLLVAPLGEGAYVYTGLALFRQFPAGVPGAFRLLANLIALRGADLTPVF